ncbi:MAG: hypothetical protein V3T05_05200, partial [Myxococcota bacterium]
RERTRFELSALVADGFASSTPTTVSACRTPIRGRTLQRSAWPPEVGLTVTLTIRNARRHRGHSSGSVPNTRWIRRAHPMR